MARNLTIATSIILPLFQGLAIFFDWYGRIFWFDDAMHFAGGLWIASVIFYLSSKKPKINFLNREDRLLRFLALAAGTVFVAVLWEFFEFVLAYITYGLEHLNELGQAAQNYTDTISDLFWVMVGAFTAGALFFKKSGENS